LLKKGAMRRIGVLLVFLSGCGGSHDPVGGGPVGQPAGPAIEIACADSLDAVYGDPGPLPGTHGAILKCAKDRDLPVDQVQSMLAADGFSSRAVTNGVHAYRVLYETERGTVPATPGISSALVLLPDTPRAAQLPVVVASHGSRGQCAACAASKEDPIAADVNPDFERQVYALAGYGFAVIAPDLAGYANFGAAGNPPSAYGSADDTGKSTLDGARALRKLVPSLVTDQVVLVGHSQGGNSALAAAALYDQYGADGKLAAVALFSPLWITQRTWGALTALPMLFPFKGNEGANAVSIWYHYIHGELLDGPGHGGDVFLASKRDAVRAFVESASWGGGTPAWAPLYALGSTTADIFDPAFTSVVGQFGAAEADCPASGDAGALCQKWKARYAADRPHLSAATAHVPELIVWGQKDTTIGATRITCAIDRLKTDGASPTLCIDPNADHSGVVGTKADYVADWIASQTLGAPAPDACALHAETDILDGNQPATCAAVPPND
jgi:pimeloyl-ACP methyl ester carboxylesterase